MKFAIILQFSEHDCALASRTARLIAELEPKFNDDWEFVFSVKSGAELDHVTFEFVAQKFKTRVMMGTRRDVGWPDGPNAQWCETVLWAFKEKRDGKADWDYIFTTEPDIVPLSPDWLTQLKIFTESVGTDIVGVRHPDHINGNMILKPEFAYEHKLFGAPSGVAWDMYWAGLTVSRAADCPLMKNLYKRTEIGEKELFEPRALGLPPVFVHGIKDHSGQNIVAKKFGIDLERNLRFTRE